MKKLLFLLILCLYTLPLYAQRPFLGQILTRSSQQAAQKQAPHQLSAEMVERVLQARAKHSLFNAYHSFYHLSGNINANEIHFPVTQTTSLPAGFAKEVYPDQTFLSTPSQTANYFMARTNRALVQEVNRLNQINNQLKKLYPQMIKTLQPTDNAPLQSYQERLAVYNKLAKSIDEQKADTVFIGEMHGFAEIELSIANFIERIRKQQSQRKIILFTEFLPEVYIERVALPNFTRKKIWEYKNTKHYIYDTALENDIAVIGLEPKIVTRTPTMEIAPNGFTSQGSLWSSLEGLRFRNTKWTETLNRYREDFPDALFIVYTGAGHSMYTKPFSLANNFPKEKTFVVTFWPGEPLQDPVSEIFGIKFAFPQPFIEWQNPTFAKTTGFDALIRVEQPHK